MKKKKYQDSILFVMDKKYMISIRLGHCRILSPLALLAALHV